MKCNPENKNIRMSNKRGRTVEAVSLDMDTNKCWKHKERSEVLSVLVDGSREALKEKAEDLNEQSWLEWNENRIDTKEQHSLVDCMLMDLVNL